MAKTDETVAPYEEWTVPELRKELEARGLDVHGVKADLAARLTADDPEPTVAELKEELRDAGLPVSGTKAELVDRLAGEDGEPKKDPRACVVDDGTAHMGRAVNGVVCSAHAMHYDAKGRRRG